MAGQWFSLGTPLFSTNEADHHDIIEILFESGFKHHNPYPIYIKIYYEFSLLHIFSLVIQPWMSAYIRKTDGVYMYVFGLPHLGLKKQ